MILSHHESSCYHVPGSKWGLYVNYWNLTALHEKGILSSLILQMSEVILEELSDLLNTPWLVQDRGGIWIQGVSYFRIYTLNLCYPAFPCHCVESVLHSLKKTLQPSNILHLQQGADRTAVLRQLCWGFPCKWVSSSQFPVRLLYSNAF